MGMNTGDSWMRQWRRYGHEIIDYPLVITYIHCATGLCRHLLNKDTNIGLRGLEKLPIETISKPVSISVSRNIRM
jgi:hypothetical protein